jgi:pimeloyl-ACP methyl ester carboxylesterase
MINYQITGKGNALVLLHGFLESLEMWESFVKFLSRDLKVVTIDLPGFGKSENFSDTHEMELMADSVKAVFDEESIQSCVMAGHSMGGYVSLAFAKKYPQMLNGLCLFHSHAAADSEEVKTNREQTIKTVEKDHTEFIISFIPDLFAAENVSKYHGEIEKLKASALKTSKKGIIAALRGMKNRDDSTEFLRSFRKPVLFITGKQDKRIPVESILHQASIPPHSELLILENVGHMGFIEAEKTTMRVLNDFATRCFNED